MLHPQARALIDLMAARGVPPTHTLSPEEARRLYRERRSFTQPDPPDLARVEELVAPGPHGDIALRLYAPQPASAGALPVLVYYHGGGWVIGDLDTHDVLCRQLALGAGCAVVSVDYRLAPEHRFPVAVDDCVAATAWVCEQADRLGLDPARVAVGGDSAGGNLAAVVALHARDQGGLPPIALQLLIYPATDQRRGAPSHAANGEGYLLTRQSMDYYHDHYLVDARSDTDWRASPLLHQDLSRLPPALVITAGYDPLRDEGLQYAQRLTESGNHAVLVNFERMVHGFILMGRALDEADAAIALCVHELRRVFAR
ncbi:alpha/beta hydrolase [Variovorax dokdonensis]|uniref:Alpha/beta hydrolase n=1 Tax=Variovorax dokdonensis TaxID=344883 RepID=A0ABT7NB01_9BURK|nr:alpha/beta hydrolase [Variovorax dokdonensis]MDM0045113.1 alpha/beta hydrolase [Variovorax dokdonensis]